MSTDSWDCVWHPGRLEVITGCMFSGKTETLIRRIQELRDAGYAVAVFRPFVDTRSPGDGLRSHSGLELAATVVSTADELRQRVSEKDQFVAIDEAQFFDEGIVDVCLDLAGAGKHLLVSGLDLDFRGMPFGPMPRLLACAQRIHKLAARCSVCGEAAFFSQRLVNGRPAAFFESRLARRCRAIPATMPQTS
jgi:thymidine kinase